MIRQVDIQPHRFQMLKTNGEPAEEIDDASYGLLVTGPYTEDGYQTFPVMQHDDGPVPCTTQQWLKLWFDHPTHNHHTELSAWMHSCEFLFNGKPVSRKLLAGLKEQTLKRMLSTGDRVPVEQLTDMSENIGNNAPES